MLYRFYIEIKHTPKYKNGAFRKAVIPFTARTPVNALRQAVKYCKDNDVEAVGFDVTPEGIPKSRRIRHKWLKERRALKAGARQTEIDEIVAYDPSEALATQADQLA